MANFFVYSLMVTSFRQFLKLKISHIFSLFRPSTQVRRPQRRRPNAIQQPRQHHIQRQNPCVQGGTFLNQATRLPELQTGDQTPPSLQSRLPVQQTTSPYEQTTPPHGQRDHTPHHMPATSTVPTQLPTTTLPAFHTSSPPPPFMPNLSYQKGATEQRNLRANDYASFLLQQCNTSLTDLPQSFVKNSLPFLQQARNTQVQYPLPQIPGNTPAPGSQPYYHATGAPYGSLVYVTHGKVKPRKRTAFTETQQAQLEDAFENKNYISTAERVKLSLEIRLSVHTILLWYQNKRARLKKKGINSKRSE
ncbi:homeobox protein ceh-23-like [Bolinopsis microptera]|uniref:homeobox protein ceh-23-like n=1 Tax=Bolinopsis microptera TaxID=2820187 RepID=UPI00307989E8